jgi:pyruvate dehydrogenase E2 component (dihydrolipoamide acetyltransferase)
MPDIDATEAAVEFAVEHGIDLAGVTGSGAGGRITKGDVEAVVKSAETDSPQPTEPPAAADVQNGLTEPERRRLLVDDVTAHMRPGGGVQPDQFGPEQDADLALIRGTSSVQELLGLNVDRVKYAGALQARAKELLEHKA